MVRQEIQDYRRLFIGLVLAIVLSGCLMNDTVDEASGDSGQVPTGANNPPQITGNAPRMVKVGVAYAFHPWAIDADGDALSFSINNKPTWLVFDASIGSLSGIPLHGNEGTYNDIEITVTDGEAATMLSPFSITVDQIGMGSATLSWVTPTQNEDGSQLADLAGFKIYYGTSTGNYSNEITINNPGVTTYVVNNLPSNTWYFVSTSFNASGVESVFSNAVSRTIN